MSSILSFDNNAFISKDGDDILKELKTELGKFQELLPRHNGPHERKYFETCDVALICQH